MSLDAFLRGARPNPAARWDCWRIEHRHAEGGPWFPVTSVGEEAMAYDELRSPTFEHSRGDLAAVVAPDGRRFLSVAAARGFVPVGRPRYAYTTETRDWEALWEGAETNGPRMLLQCDPVDRRRVVGAACDCARQAERVIPEGHPYAILARAVLDAAEAWVRGEGSALAVKDAEFLAARGIGDDGEDGPLARANNALWAAIRAGEVVTPERTVAEAANAAACHASHALVTLDAQESEFGRQTRATQRAQATLVRRWISLSEVLLSQAGDPTPLGPEGRP